MVSSKEYLDFILDQLSELEEISYRAMMGEYIIYYRGKIIGGIYDDRWIWWPESGEIVVRLFWRQYKVKDSSEKMWFPVSSYKRERSMCIGRCSSHRTHNLSVKGRVDFI